MGKIEIIAVIVFAIVFLFVGGKKLPEIARGIGQSGREFKKGLKGLSEDEIVVAARKLKTTKKA